MTLYFQIVGILALSTSIWLEGDKALTVAIIGAAWLVFGGLLEIANKEAHK